MPYKKRTTTDAQPILSKKRNNTLKEADVEQVYAIAGLLATTLAQGNAIYVTPGRFGGLQYKVYVEGDQFQEYIEINANTDDLVEELLDALYDQETVAWYRTRFGARRAERLAEGQKAIKKGHDTAHGGNGP